jgi:hypothetical protein
MYSNYLTQLDQEGLWRMFVKLLIPLNFYLGLLVWCDTEIKLNAAKYEKKSWSFLLLFLLSRG